jgi:hypothetical protein
MSGMKFDDGKLPYHLVDPFAIAWLAGILAYGAAKYAPENWRLVDNANDRYYSALKRHLEAWRTGEQDDEENGMPHLSAVMFCSMCLLAKNAPRDLKVIALRTKEAVRRALEAKAAKG